jgi:aminoglycoside phosphotransferase (APT) family kinase protein
LQPIQIDEIPIEIKEYVDTIKSIRFPRQGCTSNVGIIENKSDFYALKRTKGKLYGSLLNREVSVLNYLSETKLPIPKVNKFIEQKNKSQSWALFEFLEGQTLRTALYNEEVEEKRREMIINFGKILSQIHSNTCPSEIIYEKPWLDEMLYQAEFNLKNFKVDGTEELLKKIKGRNKPSEYKQTLIHGDFTIENVLVKNGVVTGIIDWSGGSYGDPRYDVSLAIRPKPNVFENEVDKQIFFEEYGGKIINNQEYDYFVKGIYEFF